MIDSAIKASKKHNPQTLLVECKTEREKTKMENLINDELEPVSSDDENGSESGNESDFM